MMEDKQREIYSKARIRKDKNFDGRFFFAVKTTGIFCRPSCPSPLAKEENVIYLNNMFEGLEHGFRPCHRCRPDLNIEYHNSYISGSETVERALKLIYEGYLNYHSIEELAASLYISERQLRKLFVDSIGLPPVKVGRYHKAVFARKLILSSAQSITDTAFASGFRSTRQFNSTYREVFGESPSETRRQRTNLSTGKTSMMLRYRGALDFNLTLAFMKPRLIKGVELIRDGSYIRTFRTEHSSGWFSVCDRPELSALELSVHSDDVRCYMELYYRVRRMFDLDTDFTAIKTQLGADPLLRRGMTDGRVPRLPAAFDPFEFVIRAILGQQITVKAATTLAGRVAETAGVECGEAPEGLHYFFPAADELAATDITDIGITTTRQQTIRNATDAVKSGAVSLSSVQSMEEFTRDFISVKGIGAWTVNYTAMRGLGMKDAFPAADLGIIKAMTPTEGKKPSVKHIEAAAEKWRPYRSYAALCLWRIT
ncbi:MAG TPA: hypothetical protein DCO79_05040 [Spirochaeta sp.]|nr:hypothetical protein [Spirochaeta sp.]